MGFTDRSANINALVSAHGNVNRAIEILLEGPVVSSYSGSGGADADASVGTTAESSENNETSGGGGGETLNNADGESDETEGPKGTNEKKND